MHLALKTLGCKNNDKIIIPNYSCSSNLTSVIQCGATPIIVEVERETSLGLDVTELKKAIKNHKPKIVQLVHVYGFPAKTHKIKILCKKKKILLLEDFSEALGCKN